MLLLVKLKIEFILIIIILINNYVYNQCISSNYIFYIKSNNFSFIYILDNVLFKIIYFILKVWLISLITSMISYVEMKHIFCSIFFNFNLLIKITSLNCTLLNNYYFLL